METPQHGIKLFIMSSFIKKKGCGSCLIPGCECGGVLQVRRVFRMFYPVGPLRWQVNHPGPVRPIQGGSCLVQGKIDKYLSSINTRDDIFLKGNFNGFPGGQYIKLCSYIVILYYILQYILYYSMCPNHPIFIQTQSICPSSQVSLNVTFYLI